MPGISDDASAALKASYRSPVGSKDFQYVISTSTSSKNTSVDTLSKTKYLSELRASTKLLQDDINQFLTEKMEEDKKSEAAKGASGHEAIDEVEEENYGEEAGEDDT
jgi:hypothetical protein